MAKRSRSSHGPAGRKVHRGGGSHDTGAKSRGRPPGRPEASGAPSPKRPAPELLSAFQDAMRAMQEHSYAEAAAGFRALVSAVPGDPGLLDRSQVYLALCERELQSAQPPQTTEDRLTEATAAINDGDDARAEALVRRVLDATPRHDLALYLLAVVAARRGDVENSLTWLTRALDVNPELRAQARHDADFDALREVDSFHRLLEAAGGSAGSTRRPRRGRSER